MSLIRRLLGSREDHAQGMHQIEVNSMGVSLLEASGIDFDAAAPLEQALVGTFFFGMVTAYGMLFHLSPSEVHGLAVRAFIEEFHYTDQAAAQAAQACIDAATPGHHDTMNAILHRGIDGHRQFVLGHRDALSENITSILAQFRR